MKKNGVQKLRRSALRYLTVSLSGAIALLYGARGANVFWSGDSVANGDWSTPGDWFGGIPAGATTGTTNADIAWFDGAIADTWGNSAANPVVTDTNRNLGGINFDTVAGNFFVGSTSGPALLVSSGGAIQILDTLTAASAIESINAPLKIEGASGTYTLANRSASGTGTGAGTLDIGGGITGGAAGATVLTLGGENTNANTISGNIANGTATTLGLLKTGAGTWILTGTNTYTGPTTINGGTLMLDATNGTATLGTTALNLGGGAFVLKAATAGTSLTLGNLTVATGGGSSLQVLGGTSGTTALTVGTITDSAAGGTLNIALSGTNASVKTTTHATSWTNGTGARGAVTITSGGVTSFATLTTNVTDNAFSALAISTALPLTGGATTTNYLSSASQAQTGNVLANALQLAATTGAQTLDLGAHNLKITSGGILNTSSGTASFTIAAGTGLLETASELIVHNYGTPLTISAPITNASGTGSVTLTLDGPGTTIMETQSDIGPVNVGGGAVLNLADDTTLTNGSGGFVTLNNGTLQAGASSIFTLQSIALGSGGGTFDSQANSLTINTLSGSGSLTKIGSGTLIIQGSNITGATYVNAGTLQAFSESGLSSASDLILGGGQVDLGSGTQTVGAVSIRSPFAGGDTIQDGSLTGTSYAASNTSGNAVISANLLANGSAGFTMGGPGGTVTLSGANTYTGTTVLNAGTIDLGVDEIPGESGPLGAQAANAAGTIVFAGGTLQWSLQNTFDYSGRFSTAAGQPISVDTNGMNVAFATALTSSGGTLTKLGAGVLTLSATNTYSGGTTVSAGVLDFQNTHAQPASGTITVAAGATLGLGVATTGSFYTSANLDALFAGTLANVTNDPHSDVGIDTTAGDFTYASSVPATTRGLTKLGANNLFLTGVSNYTGVTEIDGGILNAATIGDVNTASALGKGSAAGSAADLVFAGGTLQYSSAAPASTNRLFTIGDSVLLTAALDSSAILPANTLSFTNPGTIAFSGPYASAVSATLTLTGTNTGANLFAPALGDDAGGSTELDKTGTGAWIVSGANTYTGETRVSGGTLTLTGSITAPISLLIVDGPTASAAQMILSSGGSLTTIAAFIGFGATGSFVQNGGTNTVGPYFGGSANGTIELGLATGSAGTYTLNGGVLEAGEVFGSAGTSTFNFNGGTLQAIASGTLMNGLTTANVQAGGAIIDTQNFTVTISQLLQSGGATDGGLTKIGPGTLTLSGASTYTGPTIVNAGILSAGIGSVANASGAFGDNSAVRLANTAGATLDLTNFSSQIGSLTGGGAAGGNVTLGASTLTVGGDNTSPAAYAGIISGTNGALTKIGTGTLTLAGSNTYTGPTTVNAGAVLVSGNISASATTVNNTGLLGGSGGTTGTVTVNGGGTLAPGTSSSIGTLHTGALTLNGTATFQLELHTSAGTVSKDIDSGSLSLASGNTVVLSLTDLGPSTALAQGAVIPFIDYTGTWNSSTFANHANLSTFSFGNNTFEINYAGVDSGNGNAKAVTLTVLSIPEPASGGLLGLGLLLLGWRRRRMATHDDARRRTTTHDDARRRTTTHDDARRRTTTHDDA